jgi:Arylsulfotransferase (ASST)
VTRDHRGARRRLLGVAITAAALIATAVAAAPAGAAAPAQTTFYHSRRDLRPPKVDTVKPASGVAAGYIFSSPRPPKVKQRMGPLILDNQGRTVFFHPLRAGVTAVDFQVQHYKGRPVMTWSQRPTIHGAEIFAGAADQQFDVIVNQHYKLVKTVQAMGAGVHTQLHEFLLTPNGNAVVVGYRYLKRDARKEGGSANQTVIDAIVQVVSLKTGRLLFNWHAINHVPLSSSYLKADPKAAWDYFHLNSVNITPDHNLIISARHTSAAYKVSLKTGKILWSLGGKHTDWKFATPEAQFRYQHDVVLRKGNLVSLFDNHASEFDPKHSTTARGLLLRLDPKAKTASLVQQLAVPGRFAPSQGNVQHLPNGDWFVGWGVAPFASEFGPDGALKYDMTFPSASFQSYRTFRYRWHGFPGTPPALVASRDASGVVTAYASWNGSTEVRTWVLMAGSRAGHLHKVAESPWNNFETKLKATAADRIVRVLALDGSGKQLGASKTVEPKTG